VSKPAFDPINPTWQQVKAYLLERLQELRERNDTASAVDTERLRGQIAEIKVLLSLEINKGAKAP